MRKKAKILTAALIGMLFLSACGTTEADAPEATNSDGPSVKSGNTMTVISPKDNGSLNVYSKTIGREAKYMSEPFLETLWQYNSEMELEGVLCESFVYDDDNTGITLNLRQDVYWHNGELFTAEDVVYTLGTMLAESPAAPNYDYIDYNDITAVDEHTVHIGFARKTGVFEHRSSDLFIYNKAFEEGTSTTDSDGNELLACGTGAYIVTEYVKDDHVSYVKNSNYWGNETELDGLTIRFISEAATAFLEVQTGDAQITINTTATDQVDVLNGVYDELSISNGSNMSHYAIGMNQYNEYFESTLVREAMNYAIDREEVFKVAFESVGELSYTPIPSDIFGFDEQYIEKYPYSYDPDKAKDLLEQAGYSNGFECSFAIENNMISKTAAELVQSYLSEIGVTVTIDMYETAAITEVLKGEDWGLCIAMCNFNGDPASALSYQCSVKNVGTSNKFNNDDDKIAQECTALIEQAEQTSSPSEREELYHKFQELYFESPWEIPVCDQSIYAIYSNDIEGYWNAGIQPHYGNLKYKE